MNTLPRLAIVGRPNVGKSALFNRIANRRLAIVDPTEGVTRDRLYAMVSCFRFPFELIDTGGIGSNSKDPFCEEILKQTEAAIDEAQGIVLVVDGAVGVTEIDERLASMLRKQGKSICVAVNKIDTPEKEDIEENIQAFRTLGIPKIIPVSALHGRNIERLLETAWEGFAYQRLPDPPTHPLKVSIVGRPNVGKSTLLNALLGHERCIVSAQAGTTRDSISVPFTLAGKEYELIDTAGIQRKKTIHARVDQTAAQQTEKSIEACDLCLFMLDVKEGLTAQEKRILSSIEQAGKGCIILFNKWDSVQGFRMEHCLASLRLSHPFIAHCPAIVISAKTGRNLDQLFPAVDEVASALDLRITTHQLNKFLERAMQLTHPPMIQGKRLRVYYLTQVATRPPRFVLFVNSPTLMTSPYKKYLLNQFRNHYPFPGVPLEFVLKGREESRKT